MSSTAIILILISAGMHAAWNFHGKSRNPSIAYFLGGTALGTACFLPVLIYHHDKLPWISPDVWVLLVATGFCQAVYFAGLGTAYRLGDMSIAYPIARSSPIIVVTIVALILGRGDQISSLCVVGVVLVVSGCFILPMKHFTDIRLSNYTNRCCLMALLAALGTAGYSIIDDEALGQMRDLPGEIFNKTTAPMIYIVLQGIMTSSWLGIFVMSRRGQRSELAQIFRESKRSAALMGMMIYLTYGLVLASMAFADNVSYVVAFRQLSIPIGVILSIVILRESCSWPKVAGIVVLLSGLVLVAIG
jgi:uncharacterized membrane protein